MDTTTLPIPSHFVYETFGEIKYYRRGYRQVLMGLKKEEEIMGSSVYQSLIVQALVFYLKNTLPKALYWVPTNEAGLHLEQHENMANDIAIVEKKSLKNPRSLRYYQHPPKFALEVDIKIEPISTETEPPTDISMSYIVDKSQRLLDFGTEGVVWIMTRSQRIYVARTAQNLEIFSWNDWVPLFDGYGFCLRDILVEEGILEQ
jgi:hypothetical protein